MYRQGDVLLVPVPERPVAADQRGSIVLAYGEKTGHHHVIEGDVYGDGDANQLVVETEAYLRHEEHGEIAIGKGTYEVRRQRDAGPLGNTWSERPRMRFEFD